MKKRLNTEKREILTLQMLLDQELSSLLVQGVKITDLHK
jgi:hypothetical protein